MGLKKVQRTVIIRDSDLHRLLSKVIKTGLYTSIEMEPMTYQGIQNENLVEALKSNPVPKYRTLPDLYEQMLWRQKNLYDSRYLKWRFTMDYPAGQIYVQSTTNSLRQPLHQVTFTKY